MSQSENIRPELVQKLKSQSNKEVAKLCSEAENIRKKFVGDKVYLRGIIEFSNLCEKDCFYCGIRRSNRNVERFRMSEKEILDCAKWAFKNGYGSVVLQSGEIANKEFVDFLVKLVEQIKKETKTADAKKKGLGITLCVGEQKKNVYQELFDAGAHRYLLRIETSNPKLYEKIHPKECSFENRVKCLENLKEIGYQVGTGVMIGIPGQSVEDLADDILFFKKIDADMFGMGPYIIHENTPMRKYAKKWNAGKNGQLRLALNMVAATRIFLKDVNIAATTAFDALSPLGRDLALKHGANIMMPVITPKKYRGKYLLYEGKPCIDEDAIKCKDCHIRRVKRIGREIGFGKWGDSLHYFKRVGI
ncbi:MAG: [FeFe] hydrogenase H-cluster radical SAM maturase HydE [Candidatus Micrarchaeota archaeon]